MTEKNKYFIEFMKEEKEFMLSYHNPLNYHWDCIYDGVDRFIEFMHMYKSYMDECVIRKSDKLPDLKKVTEILRDLK